MALMETGIWTERTSSWAAKLTPTRPSLCISGECEYSCLSFVVVLVSKAGFGHFKTIGLKVKKYSLSDGRHGWHSHEVVIYSICILCRVNGSIPINTEIRDNILIFKGPVTYDLQGTYVCDATNSIGTRSGTVEVSVNGKVTWVYQTSVTKNYYHPLNKKNLLLFTVLNALTTHFWCK